jgi:hypothetical protein
MYHGIFGPKLGLFFTHEWDIPSVRISSYLPVHHGDKFPYTGIESIAQCLIQMSGRPVNVNLAQVYRIKKAAEIYHEKAEKKQP